jgi:plasmid stability protein
MSDLLIRNIDPGLKRRIQERARQHRQSMSDEAEALIKHGLMSATRARKMGTAMIELVPEKYREDDLIFETDEPIRQPPDLS